ncbi:PREDICTED: uncharacterized protein LOC18604774 [Theobroma cacao]|uniref:Uncharacterized protein LOC18604774 n=1 Tax=Theobroma cacao TaxID=3641 RepID=A0AB32VED2_THECC|nr:PREDICTED: uncharacterized protein LOC18604774 [Theobroma cacao]
MKVEAIIDIPATPKINEIESVSTRRHSTGKVIMPSGGVTAISRYLRTSQGSCHDICKYGTRCNLETESKSRRSSMPKIITAKRGAGQTMERTESKLGERRKKSEVSLKLSPDFNIEEPEYPVVIKSAQRQGGRHVENTETNLTDRKKSEINLKPSDDTNQKPGYSVVSLKPSPDDLVDIKTIAEEGEVPDEENAETKLSKGDKKPDVSQKPSPDSKSQKPVDPDRIEREVSSWSNKEIVSQKQVPLLLRETDFAVAHARDSKLKPQSKPYSPLKQACSSGKQNLEGSKSKETNVMSMTSLGVSGGRNKGEMTISEGMRNFMIGEKKNVVPSSVSLSPKKSSTSVSSMNARKKKSRGVCRSKKQENSKKIKPEKSCGKDGIGSKNLTGVSHLTDQENVQKSYSKQTSISDIPEKTLYIIESNPENKPAKSLQSSFHVSDLSTMPSSFSKDKSVKHTRNGIPTGQSPQSYEKKNMIYRPKGIHACGLPPSLSLLPGKKGLTSIPYGLNVTQPSLTSSLSLASSKSIHSDDSSEHDEVAAKKQKSSSKMMCKGRPKRALVTTLNDRHLQGEKLNFQRGKVIEVPLEDCTSRRLAFKRRMLADNRNDDNQIGEVEDCTPRRLKFRQRVLIDNRNGDNQNGRCEEFTPRRLKFRRRALVDNGNSDNQNGRGEDYTPRKLKFRPRVLGDNKNGNILNSECYTSKNKSVGKEADIGQEVQSDKISLRHNDVKEKKNSGILYNNMIEETASRLVRTKSSKVKALVSAFESVISLLDTSFSETNNICGVTEGL